jgi:hypothetical protein
MTRVIQHPTSPDPSEDLAELRSENARLITLLDQHGIVWRTPDRVEAIPPKAGESSRRELDRLASFII